MQEPESNKPRHFQHLAPAGPTPALDPSAASRYYRILMTRNPNAVVILGPTASGKTQFAVRLADTFNGEILSADSRQVYRGLDLCSGKDLDEYDVDNADIHPVSPNVEEASSLIQNAENAARMPRCALSSPKDIAHAIPYHLIDIVDLDCEFSVFDYQKAFYRTFEDVRGRGKLPIVAGGTGLYLEAVLKAYAMVETPENTALRRELAPLSDDALVARLKALKPLPHNTTDLKDRGRLIRAIEIAEQTQQANAGPAPEVRPLILGVRRPRPVLRRRIRQRLEQRIAQGMIQEVEALREGGVSDERLDALGLECRFISQYLQGAIRNRNDLIQKLAAAIYQFARRQETWFRRMERNGARIHWLD